MGAAQLFREIEQVNRLRLRVLTLLMLHPDDQAVRTRFRVQHMRFRVLRMQLLSMKVH